MHTNILVIFITLLLISCSDSSLKTSGSTNDQIVIKKDEYVGSTPDQNPNDKDLVTPTPPINAPSCDNQFNSLMVQSFSDANLPNSKLDLENFLELESFKKTLIKQFNFDEVYNKAVNKTYKDCLKGRELDKDFKCKSIMDTEEYKDSTALWIEFDLKLAKFKYNYERLYNFSKSENLSLSLPNLNTKEVEDYAKALKDRIESYVLSSLTQKTFSLSDNKLNETTIEYAALAELAEIIDEVHIENSDKPLIKADLEKIYETNRAHYKNEARQNQKDFDSPLFKSIRRRLDQTLVKTASIDWINVTGRNFKKGEFALTFDDGPKSSTTSELINYLSSSAVSLKLGYSPHATFFWQTVNARSSSNQQVIQRAKALGYGLASHSYSHENFSDFLNDGELKWCSKNRNGEEISLKKQLFDSKQILEELYGQQLNYFRLPYGSEVNSKLIQEQIQRLNMVHFFWNINADDWRWRSVNPKTIAANYIKEIDKAQKGIILLHDIHSNTSGPLIQAIVEHFAKNKSKYKIVPLEKATMENIVDVPANGSF